MIFYFFIDLFFRAARKPARWVLTAMDGGDGFEPSFRESKSRVLPLNEPPVGT